MTEIPKLNEGAHASPVLAGYRDQMAAIMADVTDDDGNISSLDEEQRKSFDTLAGLATKEIQTLNEAHNIELEKANDMARLESLNFIPETEAIEKSAFKVGTNDYNQPAPGLDELAKAFAARPAQAPSLGDMFVKSESYQAATGGGEIVKGAPIGVDTGVLMKTLLTSPTVGSTVRLQDSTKTWFGLLDAITMLPVGRDTIISHQYTFNTMAAAEVAEGAAKPETALTVTTATLTPKKVAHNLPITAEALADHPRMRALVDTIMVGGVKQGLEALIATDLAAWTGLATSSFNTDMTTSLLDGKVAAMDYGTPNGILIGTTDYTTLALAGAAADNNYPGPFGPATFTVWGLPVYPTSALPSGFAYVGDLSQIVWNERTPIQLAVGWVNTQFTENEVTLLAEARGMLDVMHNLAVVKTDIVTP